MRRVAAEPVCGEKVGEGGLWRDTGNRHQVLQTSAGNDSGTMTYPSLSAELFYEGSEEDSSVGRECDECGVGGAQLGVIVVFDEEGPGVECRHSTRLRRRSAGICVP